MTNILAHAQKLVYSLESLIPSVYQRENFTAMLGLFLEAKGYPLPQHSQTKSPSAISRFLNLYDWLTRQIIRTTRKQILQEILSFCPKGGTRSYFSGSGISPSYVEKYRAGERLTIMNVEIEPELLESFLLEDGQYSCDIQKWLFKGEDWKNSFYPTVTPAMRSLAQQMWNPPYRGAAKRMYLQAKVFELIAMYLDAIADLVGCVSAA